MPQAPQIDLPLPPGMSKEQFDYVLDQCSRSLKAHCLMFHGSEPGEWPARRFTHPFSYSHDAFFEVWDDPSVKKIKVVAHRGWGKTSIFGLGGPSQSIVFRKYPFIVYVGATLEGGAMLQTENLKREMMANASIQAVVGEIETNTFSKQMWETKNGCLVFPRGRGQQVRGVLYGNYRPNLIIVDDLEDKESVASKEAIDKTVEYFYGDLVNTVNPGTDDWRIAVIGTYLAHDNFLIRLNDDKDFVTLDFPITRDEKTFVSLWPERLSTEFIRQKHDELAAQFRRDVFAREFLNKPVMQEDVIFRREYFKYFSTDKGATYNNQPCYHLDLSEDGLETFVLVDPAKTSKSTSDYTAIVGVTISFSPKGNKVFVRDVIKARMMPDQIYEATIEMADRLGTKALGVEFNSLNEFIRQPLLDYMFMKGKNYEIVELKPRQATGEYVTKYKGKEGRVANVAPYYRIGAVYHNANGSSSPLEEQLVRFPETSEWDVMDAFAYFPQMLEFGGRYFADETLPAIDFDETADDPELERQFKKLEEESYDDDADYEMAEVFYGR